MAILSYLIWNGNPEIIAIGPFSLRWYGLFFALAFLIGQQIFYYIYKKEGKPEKDVDTLTIYMVVATILGARFGHVIFYEPSMFINDPLGIILPVEFSPFRFIGFQGLASHGAAIGILFGLWVYSNYSFGSSEPEVGQAGKKEKKSTSFIQRRKRPGQSYLQVVDRIVILVALAGAMIRLGNFFNSEIIGKPTDKPWAVVFVGTLTDAMKEKRIDSDQIIESVSYQKNDSLQAGSNGRVPMSMYIFFKQGASEREINSLINFRLKDLLTSNFNEFIDISPQEPLDLMVTKQDDGTYAARLRFSGIGLHPSQLYESISCVFLLVLLFAVWAHYKENLPPGRLLGIFLIVCFGLRFLYEFLKENQESFEDTLPINMGQILSIPLFVAGVIILWLSFRHKENQKA
jgi:phosphatidylglycerol---prolipoprotein diacylglyceryl transferase